MGLRLILIRHAKSDWSDGVAEDHDRILNPRGRAAAPVIGRWLARKGYLPDEVLCSDAARTRETLALILPALSAAPRVHYRPALYHAGPGAMLAELHGATGGCIAMVGHNPGIAEFAAGLVARKPAHPRFADYPTCATTVIDIDAADWHAVRPGTGRATDFVTPHDLEE